MADLAGIPPGIRLSTPTNVGTATASDNSVQIIGNIYGDVNRHTLAPESSLSYLSPSDYNWWKDRNADRAPNTCNWLLKHDKYLTWLEATSGRPLVVSADPGCGKSVLAKFLVDDRFDGKVPSDEATICHFFFRDGSLHSELAQALCALLYQLFDDQPGLISELLTPQAIIYKGALATNVDVLWKVLTEATQSPSAKRVIIVLDALDECKPDDANLGRLLGLIKRHYKDGQGHLKILMTSRPYNTTMRYIDELEESFTSERIRVQSHDNIRIRGEDSYEAIQIEIDSVIASRVDRMVDLSNKSQTYLKRSLLATPNRTYLWGSLVFKNLQIELDNGTVAPTERGLQKLLENTPRSVDAVYEKILARSTNRQMARKAFLIVLAATRPLTLREMQVLLDVDEQTDLKSTPEESYWASDESFKKRLRGLCGLFLAVYHGRVSFIHQTAREFLLPGIATVGKQLSSSPVAQWAHSLSMMDGHSTLAWACLFYLHNVDPSRFDDPRNKKTRALDPGCFRYTVERWHFHVQNAHGSELENMIALTIAGRIGVRFLKVLPFRYQDLSDPSSWVHKSSSTSGLMMACIFKLNAMVEMLLRCDKVDPDAKDGNGRTAMFYAVVVGNKHAVAMLLRDGRTDINLVDGFGMSCLHLAAVTVKAENDEVLKLLLDAKEIDFDKKNGQGRTALSLAADSEWGYGRVIRLLLGTGKVDVNARDDKGRSPLSYASGQPKSFPRVRDMLESGEAETNSVDNVGRTPLSYAAERGNYATVEVLLRKNGTNPNLEDNNGHTPLWWAEKWINPGPPEHQRRTCETLRSHMMI